MPEFHRQIGLAIIVCLIDLLESISIAKALAYRNSYDLKCASSTGTSASRFHCQRMVLNHACLLEPVKAMAQHSR